MSECSTTMILALLFSCGVLSRAFLLDDTSASCSGKCWNRYNPALACQCNDQCQSHRNCCPDFGHLCLHNSTAVTCSSSWTDVSEALWSNDVNRLGSSMYRLNFQARLSSWNTTDHSTAPFFSYVDSSALHNRPTFSTFLALQDNYNPSSYQHDALSSAQRAEVDHFLDAVLTTPVMETLLTYLRCHNIVSDKAHLRSKLNSLWFTPYSRHGSGQRDSSGFEHVMVGEYKQQTTVNGLHNWLAYYTKERAHHINYYGYKDRASPNLVALAYDWNGHLKQEGSFFVGTSPEFDLALYTLCALTGHSSVQLNGHSVRIEVYDVQSMAGFQIATAYPAL